MLRAPEQPYAITQAQARRIWLAAQKLDIPAPFGNGPAATPAAIRHLGYVQIDTIHVIERCHHHILYTRIPEYRREHLRQALTLDKNVFEYWAHALAYIPVEDMRFYIKAMKRHWHRRTAWFGAVKPQDLRKVLRLLRSGGALTIRDIDDDVLVEKDHAWASRKPSKRALQLAFYRGVVTVSQRAGMLKTYDLMSRHFGWDRVPQAASEREILGYKLQRGLRSQGIVSLDSLCYLEASAKPGVKRLIDAQVRRAELVPVEISVPGTAKSGRRGNPAATHWVRPEVLERSFGDLPAHAHLLSPFDPLILQRKRLRLLFDYEHRFEAYVPKPKRVFGYFALPVLIGDQIVAAIDLKTDRERGAVLIQQWTWVGCGSARKHKRLIEEALHRFEAFQLAREPALMV